jgi:hypothetical protein
VRVAGYQAQPVGGQAKGAVFRSRQFAIGPTDGGETLGSADSDVAHLAIAAQPVGQRLGYAGRLQSVVCTAVPSQPARAAAPPYASEAKPPSAKTRPASVHIF